MANVADSGLAVVTSVLDTDIVAVTVDPDGAGATTNRISVLNLFKGRTLSATVAFGIRSSGAAFDLQIKSTEVFTANRALTVVLNNAARTLTVAGDASVSGTNTGDQTSVSGNAGSATVLATPRAIYGNNFDGSAALTQIIASTFGGTGNGFTKFSGPTTAEKTFTLPDANATIARTDAGQTFTGVQVMTSPSITTSLVTGSTTFALINTTATTINFAGACTALNIGAAATCILNFGGGATASEFRFLEPSGSGTNYTAFKAVAQGASITYSLPATVGAAGTVLTDVAGDGVLSWAAGGGSGSAAGADTQVQFNDGGSAFGGDAGLVFNKTTNALTGTGLLTIAQAAANVGILASTGYSLTGSDATSAIDLAGTWNTSGTPTFIKVNLTFTTANAASKLIDLQLNASSRFSVDIFGAAVFGSGITLNGAGNGGDIVGANSVNMVTLTLTGGHLTAGNGGILVANHSGPILFVTDNAVDIGASGATRPRNLFVAGNGVFGGNLTAVNITTTATASTGTAVILDGSSVLRPLTSSLRFKENVEKWRPSDDAVKRFLAVDPIRFDYRDNGARGVVGFGAEDLAGVSRDLVNLDAEGNPYSNREHALFAFMHSILRSQQERISRLETRLAH